MLDLRIWHDDEVVLGPAHRLVTLAGASAALRNLSRGRGRSDEGHALHERMLDQCLTGTPIAVDQVEDSRWQAGLVDEFRDALHRAGD